MTRITLSRDVAAELPGAVDFAAQAAKLCTVSIAHTDCSYEDAAAVFAAVTSPLTSPEGFSSRYAPTGLVLYTSKTQ